MMKRARVQREALDGIRLSLPTVAVAVALVGSGAFAAGQSLSSEPPPAFSSAAAPAAMPLETDEVTEPLPPGHPPVDSDPAVMQMAALGAVADPMTSLQWQAPERWQLVPSANSMRMATYRVPRAPDDRVDAELSITRAGGSVEANAERWIGQFDPADRKTATRSTRKVGRLDVTMVQVQGKYSGGMFNDAGSSTGWALVGAVVATPGMPYFFKLTGPAKSVLAARAELDAMIESLVER